MPSSEGKSEARGIPFRDRPRLSASTVGFFVFLVLLLLVAIDLGSSFPRAVDALLIVAILFFLVRYLSTSYSIDSVSLRAFRILGGRTVRLDRIRKVEYANLRDLGTVGTYSLWGWRGRVWSPTIGRFDTVHTRSQGLLITAEEVPVFLSPRDPEAFRRELSRRVRSVTGGFDPTLAGS